MTDGTKPLKGKTWPEPRVGRPWEGVTEDNEARALGRVGGRQVWSAASQLVLSGHLLDSRPPASH